MRHAAADAARYLLHVDLNVLLKVVAVKVEHKVMHVVEAVADDDERQLVCQLRFLTTTQPQHGQ